MKKIKKISILFAALLIFSITLFLVSAEEQTTRTNEETTSIQYCDDGTRVRDINECPENRDDEITRYEDDDELDAEQKKSNTTRTGRNPQTGKEIQIPAENVNENTQKEINTRAIIHRENKENVYTSARITKNIDEINQIKENNMQARCGVSRNNEIVCVVTPYDGDDETRIEQDHTIYCWGNNELRECPREEITQTRGGGAGKVSVQDIKINSRSTDSDDEIEILSWTWGASGAVTNDEDRPIINYAWIINDEPIASDSSPSETLSLSFTKIELELGNDEDEEIRVSLEIPEVRIPKNKLVYTTIELGQETQKENGEYCGETGHLLAGGDCDDEDVEIRPDMTREETPNYIDEDDDGDEMLDEAYQRNTSNREDALRRAFGEDMPREGMGNQARIIRSNEWSEQDRERIRDYIEHLDDIRGQDFGLAIAYHASNNERVREIRYNNETNTVEIDYDEELRILGLVRMNTRATTILDDGGLDETRRPWWSFLATKPKDAPNFKAGAEISKSVN